MADQLSVSRTAPRSGRLLVPFVVLVVVVLSLVATAVNIYTDLLWFRSVDFTEVFTTELGTRVLLFVLFGVAMATLVGASIVLAYRLRPPFTPMSLEQQNLERYRTAVEPRLIPVLLLVTSVVGLFSGLAASARWQTWLQWRNGVPFGEVDPLFSRDISYFAFTYPFQRMVLGYGFGAVLLSLMAALAVHYVFGALRLQTPGDKVTRGARGHIAVLLGLFVLLKAVAYWLDRYGLAFSPRGIVSGASYTDVNAVLPAKTFLVAAALVSAALFFGAAVRRGWLLPAASLGVLVFAAVVVGGVYPLAIQQFRVSPNEVDLEAPFIGRNIEATRSAYGVDDATVESYAGETDLSAVAPSVVGGQGGAPGQGGGTSQADGVATATRLLDPARLAPTFQQLQQLRAYYGFASPLDIDRYDLGDGVRDYVVAARELDLDGLPPANRNWITDHLIYTHGHGFVGAPADATDADGRPIFAIGDLPQRAPEPLLQDGQAPQSRIYFGELSPDYSIAPSAQQEIDGPGTSAGGETTQEQAVWQYDGTGGVAVASLFRKVLFGLKFQESNFLLTDAITDESKVMFVREPRERVGKVAPWLTLDGDPYPAVVDGRTTWILDGYTTSDGFPYSQPVALGEAAADALTGGTRQALPANQVNYIRNSVKATVDAYDGTVRLYAFDETDPVLRTWMNAFPGTVEPRSAISPDLASHLRYPEDLFKVQRELLTRYHVTDPRAFYSREDFWTVPDDPTAPENSGSQPPFYLYLDVPTAPRRAFQLTSTFNAVQRPNLTAFMSASSDPDPAEYGKIRLLRLPNQSNVPGPGQAQNNFSSDPNAAGVINILQRGNSSVVFGNLLTLPVGDGLNGGLLYVEPVYVRATGGESFPLLRRVLVGFGNNVAFEPTLDDALRVLFANQAPSTTADGGAGSDGAVGSGSDPVAPAPPGAATPPSTGSGAGDLQAALQEAQDAFRDGQEALRANDFAAYGASQERLQAALERAVAIDPTLGTGGATPAPSASATGAPASAATPTSTDPPTPAG